MMKPSCSKDRLVAANVTRAVIEAGSDLDSGAPLPACALARHMPSVNAASGRRAGNGWDDPDMATGSCIRFGLLPLIEAQNGRVPAQRLAPGGGSCLNACHEAGVPGIGRAERVPLNLIRLIPA
jgi:hypothetical protein